MRERLQTSYGMSSQNADILLKIESVKDVPFDGEDAQTRGSIVKYIDGLCKDSQRDPKVVFNW